jgi:hypothetical protein
MNVLYPRTVRGLVRRLLPNALRDRSRRPTAVIGVPSSIAATLGPVAIGCGS